MRYTTAQQRRMKQEERTKQRAKEDRDEKYMHANSIMREYEKAYAAYNGRSIFLVYHAGWVRLDGRHYKGGTDIAFSNYRLNDLPRMTEDLWARVHAKEIENVTQD